jgi:uncharacterized protein (DUF849 family)
MQEIQTLTKLASILQWLVIIFIFLAGALQLTKLAVDRKIEAAQEQEATAKMTEYEQTISELQEKATELEQLKAAVVQPLERRIPTQLLPQMKRELAKFKGSSVRLACNKEDKEALAFAEQLRALFQQSGWTVKGVNHTVYSRPIENVVIILNSQEQKPKASYIFSMLKSVNIKSIARLNRNQAEDLGIIVGEKKG